MRQKQRSLYSRTDVQGKKKKVINCPFKTSYLLDSTNAWVTWALAYWPPWFSMTILLGLSVLSAANPTGNLTSGSCLNYLSLPHSHHQLIWNTIFCDSISIVTKAISASSNVYLLLIHREGLFQTKSLCLLCINSLHWFSITTQQTLLKLSGLKQWLMIICHGSVSWLGSLGLWALLDFHVVAVWSLWSVAGAKVIWKLTALMSLLSSLASPRSGKSWKKVGTGCLCLQDFPTSLAWVPHSGAVSEWQAASCPSAHTFQETKV